MFRPLLLIATLLAAAATAAPAAAQPLVRLDVVDRDTGHWLPEYRHRREGWIAGLPGHRYGVRLTNTSGERVLVVLSVDGVNAVTGQTAHPSQAGYVLEPWQSAEINGWRKSYRDIAQFVFTALPDSYAARTGRPDNVGTIGIAVFRERRYATPYPGAPSPPIARREVETTSRAAGPVADGYGAAAEKQQRIGTGHGQREWSPTHGTSFQRATTHPAQLTQLRYDSPAALAALGIPVPRTPRWHDRHPPRPPQAFPTGFVADPPAYRGW
jgi:hypothetical protein